MVQRRNTEYSELRYPYEGSKTLMHVFDENLHVLYLELGVGANTPVIIKYPFWQMTLANEKAVYACLNYGESFCPEEIADRSICIDGDIATILQES